MGDFFAFRYGGAILRGPSADGTSGQVLETDGSGNLSFATVNTDITGSTASAPSPAVDGDSDTGLFSPAPDVLAVTAGGVEGLRVTESGGEVSTVVRGDPTKNMTWNELSSNDSFAFRVGVDLDVDGGINIKECDDYGGVFPERVYLGCYNRFGASVFEVSNKSIIVGEPIELKAGSAVGSGITSSTYAFTIGNNDGGASVKYPIPVSIQRNESSETPSEGDLIHYGLKAVGGGVQHVGTLEAIFTDSAGSSFKSRFIHHVNDFNAEREVIRYEADGTQAKLGFLGASAVAQQATTGTTTGFTAGSGTAVNDDSTFTGGSGTKAYTVGDVVLALKNYGLLAAS